MVSTCSAGVAAGKLYCRKLTKFTLQADKSRLDSLLIAFGDVESAGFEHAALRASW